MWDIARHHRKEGWLRHQRKFGEATEADAAGVVFLLDSSENHSGLAISGCLRYFLNRSATPPCSDARRGIALDSNFFTASPSPLLRQGGEFRLILFSSFAANCLARSGCLKLPAGTWIMAVAMAHKSLP